MEVHVATREQQQGWDVSAKSQNLSGPSHNSLFQGDSQADKARTACQSGISVPSVLLCPSTSPTWQATSVTEEVLQALTMRPHRTQTSNEDGLYPHFQCGSWDVECHDGLPQNTTEPDPPPPAKPQNSMETCRKAQNFICFLFF